MHAPAKNRRRGVGGSRSAALWGLGAAAALGGCQPLPPSPPRSLEAVRTAPSPPSHAGNSTKDDALLWWKRSLDAPRTVPVRASVVVTRFDENNKPPAISRYELEEVAGGRKYRIIYHAPAAAAGRIVLCDGQTIWQYEPNHDTVLRRPVADSTGAFISADEAADSATAPSTVAAKTNEDGEEDDLLPAANLVRLEPEADSVAGRAVRVLVLHASPKGAVVERRWVDSRTGRTLRTETYDAQGKKRRRVEMTQVEFSPTIEVGTFVPRLAEGVRVVDTTQKNPLPRKRRDAEDTARSVHLPLRARGFALRSATQPPTPPPAAEAARSNTTHLVYSDGTSAVSVFVTPMGGGSTTTMGLPPASENGKVQGDRIALTGATGWKPALLQTAGQKRRAWIQETPRRTAIAWTQNSDRMVAVAQLPVRDLLPLVEAFFQESPDKRAAPRRVPPEKQE